MTNARATAEHRRLDAAQAEALARDGGELVEHVAPLMRPQERRTDMRTMGRNGQKVLLMELSERTSGGGRQYLAGYLGKAKLVAFRAAEPDRYGNPVWQVYASEPEPKAGEIKGQSG